MTADFEFDVFLSHSTKDKPIVRALAQRLQQDGVRVWFDEWEILPGDSIFSKIEHGLEHSRRLLLFMSHASLTSDWATLESQTVRFRNPLNKGRRLIPIRLDDTEPRGTLAQFLHIDWRTQTEIGYQQLREICLPPHRPPSQQPAHTDFAAFANAWPHNRTNLKLSFVDAMHQTIHTAQTDTNPDHCDDFILRIQTKKPGQLALFAQDNKKDFFQLHPHTIHSPATLAENEYFFPGKLLKLPCKKLGDAVQRLYFQDPGQESVIAFLADSLPPCITLLDPLSPINQATMQTLLQALLNDNNASLAYTSIAVKRK